MTTEVHGKLQKLAKEMAEPPARPPTYNELISFLVDYYRREKR